MPAPTAKRPPAVHSLMGRDLPWLVDAQAAARGDATYLIWEPLNGEQPQSWTFAAFARETRAYAAGLGARGVGQGDVVLLHMGNCPAFLFCWHACARLGAVAVITNTNSTADELAYFARKSAARFAITKARFARLIADIGHPFEWIAVTGDDAEAPVPDAGDAGIPDDTDLRGDPDDAPTLRHDVQLPCSIQFTSGTTSRPKGVVWTHGNCLWAAQTMARVLELTPVDCTPVFFPLFHTNALAYSMLSTLHTGSTAVLMPRFSASRFWDVATRHGCTWASMAPFPIRALLAQPDPSSHSFRLWTVAGDLTFVRDRWGIRTLGWYGMTETIAACIASDPLHPAREWSMGRPRPEYELSVRLADGREAQVGESGKLFVRGVPGISLFRDYLDDPAATAASFDADGWFDTGDEIVAHPDGEMFFISREKDMLKVGGENVAALEIETVIAQVPGVAECAVVGKPDEMYDEVPVAFVVARTPSAELEAGILAQCEAKLSAFKRPREVRFIDALPTGLLGKILKRDLREMARAPKN